MYYSTGCSHAPHHVWKEWSEKYKGRFDQGWDKLREETFERQKKLGVVPADAELTPRPEEMPAWDSLDENSKRLFARQMEVYAGYSENADHHVGRLLDAIEEMGELEDTLVIWIWGDNGASLEGTPTGTFNEGTMVNGLPLTDARAAAAGAEVGWAGGVGHRDDVPALLHRLGVGRQHAVSSGASRSPRISAERATRWSSTGQQRIEDGGGLRSQFTHVTDIGPTVLDLVGIPQPTHVDGVEQQPMTGRDLRRLAGRR